MLLRSISNGVAASPVIRPCGFRPGLKETIGLIEAILVKDAAGYQAGHPPD